MTLFIRFFFFQIFSYPQDEATANNKGQQQGGGRHEKNRSSSTSSVGGRAHADLVKWQGQSLRQPLLKLPPDLAPLAIECFDCILRYSGDLPPDPDLPEVKCVYTVLMVSDYHIFNFS